jgi:hypothetical protein
MNAKEYINKYGEAAYNFLSDEDKRRLESQDSMPSYTEQSNNTENYSYRGGEQDGRNRTAQEYLSDFNAAQGRQQYGRNRTRGEFALAEEEKILKNYHALRLRFPPCEGYLTVTNKRLIFRGDGGGNSFVMNEVKIDSVSGFASFCGARYIAILSVLGLLCLLYGLSGFLGLGNRYGNSSLGAMRWAAIIGGVVMLYFSRREVFSLKVFSSQAQGGPIEIGEGLSNAGPLSVMTGSSAVYSLIGGPTDETRPMLYELGAIVRDLQTLDEETVFAKWGRN